ncbi:MAG: PilZ domain-containing protein [Candidatus Sulfotelmatobacter sp.]
MGTVTDKKTASDSGETSREAASSEKKSGNKFAMMRRFPRFTLDVRLQVKMFQNGEFCSCWGRSTEIGQDGIGATLTGSLEQGEIVTLEIPLPLTPYPIKVRAIVRYVQGLRYGFEFLTLKETQRDTVRRVCEYLATKA